MSLFHKDLDRAETKVLKRCRRYDFVLEIYIKRGLISIVAVILKNAVGPC